MSYPGDPNQPQPNQPPQQPWAPQPSPPQPGYGQPAQPPGYGQPQYGPPGQYPPGQPPKKSRTGLIVGIVVGVLLLAGIAFGISALLGGGGGDPATVDPTTAASSEGATSEEPTSQEPTSDEATTEEDGDNGVATAAVGACVDTADLTGEVTEIPTVDCSEEHDSQVVGKFDMEDGDWPGDDAVQAAAEDQCVTLFADFVGIDYAQSSLNLNYVGPSEETWTSADDREVLCIAYTDSPTTGSWEGSGS